MGHIGNNKYEKNKTVQCNRERLERDTNSDWDSLIEDITCPPQ